MLYAFLLPDVARIDKTPVTDVLLFIRLYSSSLQLFRKLRLVLQPAYRCEKCIFKNVQEEKSPRLHLDSLDFKIIQLN